MAGLPSYREAVQGPDPLALIAPYIPPSAYARLCRVSRKYHAIFAPLLWRDPLLLPRLLSLDPSDDLVWYRRFMDRCTNTVRLQTRMLVRSLDFRRFAPPADALFSTDGSENVIPASFRHLHRLFPALACLLLDGHPDLDPALLALHCRSSLGSARDRGSLRLLDVAHCARELSPRLLEFGYFRDLQFLDVSFVAGSFTTALSASLNPTCLPALRVLKARGREIGDAAAQALCQTFQRQLWSLDLSDNKLTDAVVDDLAWHCIDSCYHSDLHFEREGKLVMPRDIGTRKYGPFQFIQDSAHSFAFEHGERYLADAPVFFSTNGPGQPRDQRGSHSHESALPHQDRAGVAKLALLNETDSLCDRETFAESETCVPRHGGITHLYLNANRLTWAGFSKLVRLSGGALRHLECSHALATVPAPGVRGGWENVQMNGILGLSHILRPVLSSNLRSLRVHHSVVTAVPTVTSPDLSPASCLSLSESLLFNNARRAYPSGFVPDMNPRLVELTLTGIPRRSTGTVTRQLIRFLELAALQERNIKQAGLDFKGRGSIVVPGIRKIRLEIGSDVDSSQDGGFYSGLDSLLDPGHTDFGIESPSFFDQDTMSITSRAGPHRQDQPGNPPRQLGDISKWTSGRLEGYPYTQQETEHLSWRVEAADSWTGNVFSIPVWIGSGRPGPHPAVNQYMWNLRDPNLLTDPGPATPDHVKAGVPPMSFLFYGAWDAILLPPGTLHAAAAVASSPSHDVVEAVRAHRQRTRGTPEHYGGALEVVLAATT